MLFWSVVFILLASIVQYQAVNHRVRTEFDLKSRLFIQETARVLPSLVRRKDINSLRDHLEVTGIYPEILGFDIIDGDDPMNLTAWVKAPTGWVLTRRVAGVVDISSPDIENRTIQCEQNIILQFYFSFSDQKTKPLQSVFGHSGILVLSTLLSAFTGFFFLNYLGVKPILKIRDGVIRLSSELNHRLPPLAVLELDELRLAVNTMAEKLQNSISERTILADKLKEHEAIQKGIFNFISHPVLILKEGHLASANPSARSLLNIEADDADFHLEGLQHDLWVLIEKIKSGRHLRQASSLRRVRPFSGVNRLYDIILTKVDEEALWEIVEIIDVTDTDRDDQINIQRQKVETIGLLAGGVVHDLNNILGGLTGTTSILRYYVDSGKPLNLTELEENLKILETCNARAVKLTKGLLDLSPRSQKEIEQFEIHQLLEQAWEIVKFSAPKGVVFSLDRTAGDILLEGDRGQIQQIVLNLLVNALHAVTFMKNASEGQGKIVVHIDRISAQPVLPLFYEEAKLIPYVRLVVCDDGVGIDKETQERIFDPFFTTKSRDNGTGLGLSLVRNTMINNNGFIALSSSPGVGSAFSLFFPAKEGNSFRFPQGVELVLCHDSLPFIEDVRYSLMSAGVRITIFEGLPSELPARVNGILIDKNLAGKFPLQTADLAQKYPYLEFVLVSPFSRYFPFPENLPYPIIGYPFLLEELLELVSIKDLLSSDSA